MNEILFIAKQCSHSYRTTRQKEKEKEKKKEKKEKQKKRKLLCCPQVIYLNIWAGWLVNLLFFRLFFKTPKSNQIWVHFLPFF